MKTELTKELNELIEIIQVQAEVNPDYVIRLAKEAIAAIKEDKWQGWISVNDKLPENWQVVLVWSSLMNRCIVNSYHEHTDQDSAWFKRKFTHWMPLPEEPKF